MIIRLLIVLLLAAFAFDAFAEQDAVEITIRSITIDNQNIFDLTQAGESGGFYKLANALHVKTKQSVILDQLLFSVGSAYKPSEIAESERILRSNRYLRDATINAKIIGDKADIFIKTEDTWSTKPTLSYSKKADATSTKIGIQEDNFLGYGVHASLEYVDDPERSSTQFRIADRNVFGSRYQLNLMYASNSDGNQKTINIERPFYELNSGHAQGFLYDEVTQINSLYDRDGKIYSYDLFKRELDFYKGWSAGLQNGYTIRHRLGFHTRTQEFYDEPSFSWDASPLAASLPENYPQNLQVLPENSSEHYPYYSFEYIEDDYIKTSNFEQIGRTEDRHIGLSTGFLLGYASETLGSEGNNLKASSYLSNTWLLSDKSSINFNGLISFDVDSDSLHNIQTESTLQYFYQQTENWQSYLDFHYARIHDQDYRQQLFLGSTTGLRGYPEHFLSGTETLKFTAEERFFSDWNPWHIFNIGAAVFLDAGRATGDEDINRVPDKIYSDIGFGLRIANNRSSLGNIVHLDFAFPLQTTDEASGLQFSMAVHKTF